MQNVKGPAVAADADHAVGSAKPGLKARAMSELKKYIIITLYLWVLFALFSLYRRMILQENGISVWEQSFAIVNALIFAKVILIAQALNLGAWLRKYRVVYTVLGNAFLFMAVVIAFHVFEEAVRALAKGQPLETSIADFGGGTVRGFLTMGAILFVCLIPFFGVEEVSRAVGGQALWDLFFSRRDRTFRLIEE
jgi:hypothetical protein